MTNVIVDELHVVFARAAPCAAIAGVLGLLLRRRDGVPAALGIDGGA